MALLPLFVDFSLQARPYIAGWSLGLVALYYALASPHRKAFTRSAIFMGLAVSSRIDMVLLLPIVWNQMWNGQRHSWLRGMLRYHAVLIALFLIVAPWFLMTLIACFRAVGTARGSTTGLVVANPMSVFRELIWDQGMVVHVALLLCAIAIWILRPPRRWFLAGYLLFAGLSVFKGAAHGLRYQGAPILLMIVVAIPAMEILQRRFAAASLALSVAALLPLAGQTVRLVAAVRRNYVPDFATQWVEEHVPPGAMIYLRPALINPLPTLEAADDAWAEVSALSAYQRKFSSGINRFGLTSNQIPRALSEVNLALERGNRRFLFILGGRQWIQAARFDIRVFGFGPVFGVRDLFYDFKQTGGVVILRGAADDPIAAALGTPTTQWLGPSGAGTRVYCSPDIARRLR